MLLIKLFFTFFRIGLFAVGGGLATLPFLYELAEKNEWISTADISNLVAISESTPGPLGINMSTYVGFLQSGPIGAVVASVGLVVPSIVVIVIMAKFLDKFKDSKIVKDVFYGLRAASCALIGVAGLGVAKLAFLGKTLTDFFWQGAVLAVILFFLMKKLKLHPVVFIAISAIIGIVFKFEL